MNRKAKGPAFKMKSSPVKGKLDNFFSNLGKQLQSNKKDIGGEMKDKYSSKAQRANKVAKPGESKYQFDVRTRKSRKKPDKYVTQTTEENANIDPASEIKIDPKVGRDRFDISSLAFAPGEKTTKTPKTPKTKFSGSGTDARKKQYDAKGWRYDDTIKGYNRDGSQKKFVVQTGVTKTPNAAGDDFTQTVQNEMFNTKKESDAYIADNKGSFGYKIDDKGNRIEKKTEKKTKVIDPAPNVAAKETGKDTNLLAQILKPGFMHALDAMNSPADKKSPSKKRGYKMKRK